MPPPVTLLLYNMNATTTLTQGEGNQGYFGMKAHIGVDSKTKMIHSVAATAANVHDSQVLEDLLHGAETRV